MTGFTVEKLENFPALLATWLPDFEFGKHAQNYSVSVQNALNEQTDPVFYIMDMTPNDKMSFQELIEGSSMAARGSNPNFHHPMVQGVLLVTKNIATQAAAKGLKSDTFGNVNAHVFTSLDDALAFVQKNS